jgi:hypothetical protein
VYLGAPARPALASNEAGGLESSGGKILLIVDSGKKVRPSRFHPLLMFKSLQKYGLSKTQELCGVLINLINLILLFRQP